jgi:hypothetical protein
MIRPIRAPVLLALLVVGLPIVTPISGVASKLAESAKAHQP